MVYAYVTDSSKSIDFNMYKANHFITSQEEYEKLKQYLFPTDTLLIEHPSLLGNTLNQMIKELMDLKERKIKFVLLDNQLINSENLEAMNLISYLSSINLSKKVKIGRPETEVPVNFSKLYRMYLMGDTQRAIQLSGLSRATFYRRLAKYEKENGYVKRRNNKAMEYGKTLQNFKLDNRTLEQYPLLKL